MWSKWKKVGALSKMLTGKPTGNRPLASPKRRYGDNIRMNLKEIGVD